MVRWVSSFSSFLGLILAQEGFKAKNYLFIKLKLRDTGELIFATERHRSVDCGGGPKMCWVENCR